jgi:hypothetical protein
MTPLRVCVRDDPSVTTPAAVRSGSAWPLPRGVIAMLGLACGVVVLACSQAVAEVLGPVFLALMLTVAVHPLLAKALLADIDPSTRWLSALISSRPAPAEDGDHEVGGPVDAVVVPELVSPSGRQDTGRGPAAD